MAGVTGLYSGIFAPVTPSVACDGIDYTTKRSRHYLYPSAMNDCQFRPSAPPTELQPEIIITAFRAILFAGELLNIHCGNVWPRCCRIYRNRFAPAGHSERLPVQFSYWVLIRISILLDKKYLSGKNGQELPDKSASSGKIVEQINFEGQRTDNRSSYR